jgi:hypothetical protein
MTIRQTTKTRLVAALAGIMCSQFALADAFAPGNVLIYRVGNGTDVLSPNGNAVFIDEYAIDGSGMSTLVQSVPMPVVLGNVQRPCIAGSTATSEGLMTRTPNGAAVVFTCYGRDLVVPTPTAPNTAAGTVVPRVIARLGANGVVDTSTALTDSPAGYTIRSAASDGTNVWVVGSTTGVRATTFGATTSTEVSASITNARQIDIVGGNLLLSHGSAAAFSRVAQIGTGLPTITGQVPTNLTGFPATAGLSIYGFAFFDLDATVGGLDTAYTADDAGDVIQKWSLVAGIWTLTGTINSIAAPVPGLLINPRGLVARIIPGIGVAFATVADATSVVVGVDSAGYNVAPNAVLLAAITAGTNKVFRGLTATPEAAPAIEFRDGFE